MVFATVSTCSAVTLLLAPVAALPRAAEGVVVRTCGSAARHSEAVQSGARKTEIFYDGRPGRTAAAVLGPAAAGAPAGCWCCCCAPSALCPDALVVAGTLRAPPAIGTTGREKSSGTRSSAESRPQPQSPCVLPVQRAARSHRSRKSWHACEPCVHAVLSAQDALACGEREQLGEHHAPRWTGNTRRS